MVVVLGPTRQTMGRESLQLFGWRHQALTNILSRAISYTSAGARSAKVLADVSGGRKCDLTTRLVLYTRADTTKETVYIEIKKQKQDFLDDTGD